MLLHDHKLKILRIDAKRLIKVKQTLSIRLKEKNPAVKNTVPRSLIK